MSLITTVDDHGVVEYRKSFLAILTVCSMMLFMFTAGYILYTAEVGHTGPIQTYKDATWTILMSATTIGFGDYYPSTGVGRTIVMSSFFVGAIHFAILIAILSSVLGADKSIQNRELRTMLSELMRKQEQLEKHLDMCTAVNKDSHNLDVVFDQKPYSSNRLRDGFITMGKDSSGMYMMSICAYDRETDQEYHRWIPESSKVSLFKMFERYIKNKDEL